jgi:hypothetical protein
MMIAQEKYTPIELSTKIKDENDQVIPLFIPEFLIQKNKNDMKVVQSNI